MFGLCVFRKLALVFCLLFFTAELAQAQTKKTAAASRGVTAMVVGESPYVFANANFDSPIIGELKPGQKVIISKAKKGPFHRVRLPNKKLGWIADSEVKIMSAKAIEKAQKDAEENVGNIFADSGGDLSELEDDPQKRKQYMQWSRHRGIAYDIVQYTEDTQGEERTEALGFIGFRMTGADTLFSGLATADTHVLFSTQVPSYYKKLTSNAASGFVSLWHFQFLTQTPLSRSTVYHYGFGPMVKYSQFQLKVGNKTFTAEDLNIGAVFGFGLGFKLGPIALRPDFKYYWEKTKYWSLGLGLLYEY
ncbi:MAG: SH3 domain-containing protein [Bdellovibrionia bacterium]